jgi:hypothetical protein
VSEGKAEPLVPPRIAPLAAARLRRQAG